MRCGWQRALRVAASNMHQRRACSSKSGKVWGKVAEGRTSLWGKPDTLVHPDVSLDQAAIYEDVNFPRAPGQRVLHLDLGPNEVANRILSVGDPARAKRIASLLDDEEQTFYHLSGRGFATYTGMFQGQRISVLSTGMGFPMMDFAVRECRAIVDGTMAIARFGTCGGLQTSVDCGSIAVAKQGSVMVMRNPDAFCSDNATAQSYTISQPVQADELLSELMEEELIEALGDNKVVAGLNASTDSFYASQGRVDRNFDDRNGKLIQDILQAQPDTISCEMEAFHLLDLARCSHDSIRAGAASVVLGHRITNDVMMPEQLSELETMGGLALLKALARWKPPKRAHGRDIA